ncbi:hypothetical protein D0962_35700 [Leptolyngbyaceae cyanobacterium CCMR0082]|uniref:Uncharacterized protein n=1 Tax=Adonisia turfae CCMR0082 TaxID=2304604 RepID=A0A6M0SHJ0_9CYAN|nr:hypothetical protein [Adonisia turfae]NEZ68018.1 hypothetical protein [Adonisia turfae CCMR0082]
MTLRFRYSEETLPVSLIKRLCDLTSLSIGELRSRVSTGESILSITAFENNWEEERVRLASVIHEIAGGSLPLSVSEVNDDNDDDEAPIEAEVLVNILRHYREIELQDQRSEDLRMGVINDPSDFEPHDDDWTVI